MFGFFEGPCYIPPFSGSEHFPHTPACRVTGVDFSGWHHVAVTRGVAGVLMYLDGQPLTVQPSDGNNCSVPDMFIDRAEIGSYALPAYVWRGGGMKVGG